MAITKVTGHVIDPITNITSHNINSSGIITATRFDGPIGAGLTDGNFSGIITATQLNVTGVGTFNGIGVTSLNVSGVSTFSGNIFGTGDITITDTTADSAAGPELKLYRNSASPADADYLGQLKFAGESDTGVERNYAKITGKILDASNGTEDGILEFAHIKAGSQTITGRWRSDSLQLLNGTSLTVAGTADVTGNMTVGGNLNVSGVLTYEDVTNIDSLGIVTARTGIKVLAGGINAVGVVTATSFVGDGSALTGIAGTAHVRTASLTVSGVSTFSELVKFDANVSSTPSASGNVHIYRHDNKLKVCGGSGIQFEEGGFTRWHITNGALHPHGTTYNNLGNTSNLIGNVYLADDKRLTLGSDQDMYVFHDNTHGYVSNRKNNLYVEAPNYVMITSTDTNGSNQQTSARFYRGGASDLYHSNTLKFSTSSTGVTVTGEVAATQDYPNIRPTLDFNFAAVKKLDPRITYSRTGPASYVDEFGIVKLVGDNEPRFDHDPATGECKGLLIEESRTSRLTASTHNDASNHYKQTDRGETIKGPDGVENSAREYTVNSDGGTSGTTTIWGSEAMGIANATSFSFFVKITRGSTMAFRLFDNNNNLESEKWTISGGAITDGVSYATVVQSDPGSTEGTTSYERYPNGWVRCKWEGASGSANASSYLQLYIWDHAAANSDGDNIGYAIWGFQVENGAHCTSTIPKPTTAAVTRGWEVPIITGTELTDVFNPTEGTMFYEASVSSLTNDNQPIVAFRDLGSTTDNYHAMGYRIGGGSSGNIRTWFKSNNANTYLSNHGSTGMVAGVPYKHMYGYKLNDATDAYNTGAASAQTTDSSVTPMITGGVVDELRFGGYYSGPETTTYSLEAGHIKRFSYWKTKLSNTQIKTYVS